MRTTHKIDVKCYLAKSQYKDGAKLKKPRFDYYAITEENRPIIVFDNGVYGFIKNIATGGFGQIDLFEEITDKTPQKVVVKTRCYSQKPTIDMLRRANAKIEVVVENKNKIRIVEENDPEIEKRLKLDRKNLANYSLMENDGVAREIRYYRLLNRRIAFEYNETIKAEESKMRIVTDYIPGSIFWNLKFDSASQFLQIAIAFLEELKNFHNLRLVHGDIKGNNLFVSVSVENGQYKIILIDFSLTAEIGTEIKRIQCEYIAPEICSGASLVADYSQDVYSAGTMLYGTHYYGWNDKDIPKCYADSFKTFHFVQERIKSLCEKMRNQDPLKRIDLQTAHQEFKKIKVYEEYLRNQDQFAQVAGKTILFSQQQDFLKNVTAEDLADMIDSKDDIKYTNKLPLLKQLKNYDFFTKQKDTFKKESRHFRKIFYDIKKQNNEFFIPGQCCYLGDDFFKFMISNYQALQDIFSVMDESLALNILLSVVGEAQLRTFLTGRQLYDIACQYKFMDRIIDDSKNFIFIFHGLNNVDKNELLEKVSINQFKSWNLSFEQELKPLFSAMHPERAYAFIKRLGFEYIKLRMRSDIDRIVFVLAIIPLNDQQEFIENIGVNYVLSAINQQVSDSKCRDIKLNLIRILGNLKMACRLHILRHMSYYYISRLTNRNSNRIAKIMITLNIPVKEESQCKVLSSSPQELQQCLINLIGEDYIFDSLNKTSSKNESNFNRLYFFLSSLVSPLRYRFLHSYEIKCKAIKNYQPREIGHIFNIIPEEKHEDLFKKYVPILNSSISMQRMLSSLERKYEPYILDLSTRYWVAEKDYSQTLLDLDRDYKNDPILYFKMMIAMNRAYYFFRNTQATYSGRGFQFFSWDKDSKVRASLKIDSAARSQDLATLEEVCTWGPAAKSRLGDIAKRLLEAAKLVKHR